MSDESTTTDGPVIRLEGVGKCYRIFQNPQDRFRQAFLDRFQPLTRQTQRTSLYREHWALRDVSFELQRGEAVGILGRNGAGKSTLLQVIAGTLDPTTGSVATSGRITALLELGSGFNPEFTGRENVFLNGQILGLTRDEVVERFDDIASFADIGDFIDQPVKTYSSGMMMRLAFSVQTALTPDVLIVDEALAVGDIFFQAKCMRRLREMREQGTTILFVSHATSTVREICTRAMLLEHGRVVADGSPGDVVHKYIESIAANQASMVDEVRRVVTQEVEPTKTSRQHDITARDKYLLGRDEFIRNASEGRTGNHKAEFLNAVLLDSKGRVANDFAYDETVTCAMLIRINRRVENLWIGYKIRTVSGIDIVHADTSLYGQLSYPFAVGRTYVLEWRFNVRLVHGAYLLGCIMGSPDPPTGLGRLMEYIDIVNVARTFSVGRREEGMIGATVVWDNELDIHELGGV